VTNDRGHQLARAIGAQITLGVYRGRMSWVPGATIDVWVPCARGDAATGVPSPHVYFVQTIGERSSDSGSIHCPTCRAELTLLRASRPPAPAPLPRTPTKPRAPQVKPSQGGLPF
jgi:hypothetical protein